MNTLASRTSTEDDVLECLLDRAVEAARHLLDEALEDRDDENALVATRCLLTAVSRRLTASRQP